MKKVFVLVTLILLTAVNLFAGDGDLIVDGKIGIGVEMPNAQLDVVGNGKITVPYGIGLLVSSSTQALPQKPAIALNANAYFLGGDGFNRSAQAGLFSTFLKGSDIQGNASIEYQDIIALENKVIYGNTDRTDTYTFTGTDVAALRATHNGMGYNKRVMNFDSIFGLQSLAYADVGSTGKIHATNFYHAYFQAFKYSSVWQADNIYGLYIQGNSGLGQSNIGIWVGKNNNAAYNYGIVLDGDGAGADLVFGDDGQGVRPKIFSENGYLKAQDTRGNITQFSPHDPETGEWIFYSKNTKTGRTVRVNMEELVKDMEKLTGKKYLIESFVNTK